MIFSPIKYYGGAHYKCKKIISIINWNDIYCEPFLGGGNVLLNSPDFTSYGKKITKYAFDKNWLLINCWKHIQSRPDDLVKFLRNVDHSKENFHFACEYINNHKVVEEECQYFMLACQYLIRNRFSRAADEKTFGYSPRLRRGMPEYTSAWLSMIDNLSFTSYRIKDVIFDCGDAIQLMNRYGIGDRKNSSIYADPPFCHESRVSKNAYQYEMKTYRKDSPEDETAHESLLDYFIWGCEGKIYLSGYKNSLYNDKLSHYKVHSWSMTNSQSSTKKKKIMEECLWEVHNVL